MKKSIALIGILCLVSAAMRSQDNSNYKIPLIGSDAPKFSAQSTEGTITFPDDFGSNWKILFSHPRDFTPVCSSELLELAQRQEEFKNLGVKLVVLSTDVLSQHKAWKSNLDTLRYKNRTPVTIKFPIVDDNGKSTSMLYGMLHTPYSTTQDVRGVFVIDPKNKVRAIFFYPSEVGRNINEIERTVIALQTADKQHVIIPANWNPGNDVLIPYADKNTAQDPTVYQIAPFMTAKKLQ